MKDRRKYSDRAAYLIKAVHARRRKIKEMAVAYKGSQCYFCGYKNCIDALEFHHFIGDKTFSLSKDGITRSWQKTKDELNKCILVCANCHREIHAGLLQLPQAIEDEK